MMHFPKCVAAARKGEASRWELAYALVEEVKDKKGEGPDLHVFEVVSDEIERETGENYSPNTLEDYRNAALAYPLSLRRKVQATGVAVSFSVYGETDPEKIFDLIEAVKAKKKGKRNIALTQDDVYSIQAAWRAAADRQHERELEKQERMLEKARADKQKALDLKRNAETEAARAKAQAMLEAAEEAIDESRVPPKRNENYRPEPEMMPVMMVPLDIASECDEATKIGEYVNELLTENFDKLDNDALVAIEYSLKQTVKVWQKALDRVGKKTGNVVKFPKAS